MKEQETYICQWCDKEFVRDGWFSKKIIDSPNNTKRYCSKSCEEKSKDFLIRNAYKNFGRKLFNKGDNPYGQ